MLPNSGEEWRAPGTVLIVFKPAALISGFIDISKAATILDSPLLHLLPTATMSNLFGASLLTLLPSVVQRGIICLAEDVLAKSVEAVQDMMPVVDASGISFCSDYPAPNLFLLLSKYLSFWW